MPDRRDPSHLRSGTDLVDIETADAAETPGQGPAAGSPGPSGPSRPSGLTAVLASARNVWRQLTSMRVALVLLFLLALASLPGALLPQWAVSRGAVQQFITENPTLGPLLDKAGFFGVFGAPWYAGIYLALFASLVGCLIPRTWDFVRALRAEPVATPRNLSRLPHHATGTTRATDPAGDTVRGLRGWRLAVRDEAGASGIAVRSISAEKGFLREVGNLVFHLSLLGLLASIAVGKMFGFEGTVVVTEGSGFCSSSPAVYDSFRPGLLIDGTELAPFCADVERFSATFGEAGQAIDFTAAIRYQSGTDAGTDRWTDTELKVNEPLRVAGERLYLLGHGFSPEFTVRYPTGITRTVSQTFMTTDSFLLSEGVVKIADPPGYTGEEVRKHQLAIQGLFAPTAFVHGGILSSAGPEPADPAVAIQIYRGDLGLDSGRNQSVFGIDQAQVDSGALEKLDRANLRIGESMTIDDGTVITFSGYKQWVQLQTSYDPAQGYALIFAVLLLGGLMLSLLVKRRRVWFRFTTIDGEPGTRVEVGGLARTDQAGYGEEFARLAALVDPPGGGAFGSGATKQGSANEPTQTTHPTRR
jgi:cytochrome c biogenesis protein